MTTHEIRHLNLVEAVCARPKLFTPSGTLSEVIAFLAGCEYGKSTAYANDDSPAQVIAWLLRDVMDDSDVEPQNRLATAIEQYGTTEIGLAAIRQFAATLNAQ